MTSIKMHAGDVGRISVQVRTIASRVEIRTWTDTQYGCLSVLDGFAHLGETAWDSKDND